LYGGFKSTVENIYIDGAFNGLKCVGNTFGVRLKNLYLGSIRANTYDITILSGASGMDAVLDTIYSNPTISVSERSNIVDGGFLRILNLNNVSGENRVIQTFGDSYITGSSLSDTTLHNGNPCLKFRSVSGYFPMSWEQTIPTGDIQNRDMMVGVWVKLNSANYWAGLNQMPRLTINYDDGTIAYAEASQSTDWQYLFVPFTPTTTFGSIKAKLTSMTDATTTDADVYFSDMSVLYPAGYTLNLGKFDNLNDGFPVVPTISTSVSAQDVWSADPDQFGADTVGDKVNKIKNDTGLIPATL
jgi:hypothetical protein